MMRWAVRLLRDRLLSPQSCARATAVVLEIRHRQDLRVLRRLTRAMSDIAEGFGALTPLVAQASEAVRQFGAAWEGALRESGMASDEQR